MKGLPVASWRLVPLILTAAAFATVGKRFLNRISGLLLGGIGGAVGTMESHSCVYGCEVGLLVGVIVVLIPVIDKPKSNATRPDVETHGY